MTTQPSEERYSEEEIDRHMSEFSKWEPCRFDDTSLDIIRQLRAELAELKTAIRFLEGCSYESIWALCEDILTGGVATDEEKQIAARLQKVLEA